MARPGSLSLIIRGPALSDYNIRFDESGTWPQDRKYGRKQESKSDLADELVTREYVHELSTVISGNMPVG